MRDTQKVQQLTLGLSSVENITPATMTLGKVRLYKIYIKRIKCVFRKGLCCLESRESPVLPFLHKYTQTAVNLYELHENTGEILYNQGELKMPSLLLATRKQSCLHSNHGGHSARMHQNSHFRLQPYNKSDHLDHITYNQKGMFYFKAF